jgi:serine/threonine protein kinase
MPYDVSVDIWACGMIIFELITKKVFSFSFKFQRLVYSKYMMKKEEYLKNALENHKGISYYFDLIVSCLSQNPTQRPSASEILMKLKGTTYQNAIPKELINDTISDPSQSSIEQESDEENAISFLNSISIEDENEIKETNLETSISRIQETSIPENEISDPKRIQMKSSISEIPKQRMEFYHSFSSIYRFENTKKVYHHREVIKWSVDRVLQWLDEIELGNYKFAFQYNEINGENLLELHDIQELKLFLGFEKLGHIKTLQKYIQLMREGE